MNNEDKAVIEAMQVVILADRLSFVPDETTSGTMVLDGNTVEWELDNKPSPMKRSPIGGHTGNWVTYFEGDKQVIHPDDSCKRYLLGFARQLSVTEAETIYVAIVWALQDKVHPDHCHCQPCKKYHDEVIVPRVLGLLREQFPTWSSASMNEQ